MRDGPSGCLRSRKRSARRQRLRSGEVDWLRLRPGDGPARDDFVRYTRYSSFRAKRFAFSAAVRMKTQTHGNIRIGSRASSLTRETGFQLVPSTSWTNVDQDVVAQIQQSRQHPNADRLTVCIVDDGSGRTRQIVCGAKNYQVGDKVPLALPGAELSGELRIRESKLRGVDSEGMLCSAK